jgi:small subunit ribosomal protein S5
MSETTAPNNKNGKAKPQGSRSFGGNNKRNTRGNSRRRSNSRGAKTSEYDEKVLEIRRVSKKTKGGNQIGFTALVVIGDRKGSVGCGYGKAKSVVEAIGKAISNAKENTIKVVLDGQTIPHDITVKYGASHILLKPAPEGTGIIAGGSVRTVVDLAGIHNISSKMLGTKNKICNVRCAIKALSMLRAKK